MRRPESPRPHKPDRARFTRRFGGAWLMPIRLVWVLLLWLPIVAVVVGAVWLATLADGIPEAPELASLQPPQPSRVVTRDGWLLAGAPEAKPVAIWELEPQVVAAFIASEDTEFFEHRAFHLTAILRAALSDWRAGKAAQGGSTITQQVAKRFLSPEKTLRRKFNELLLARRIEATYTKSQILEAYLNSVYFGEGAYGIARASWTYFGKPATRIDVSQAATLAAVLPAPSVFNPVKNPEIARQKRDRVLRRMAELGLLSKERAAREIARPIELSPRPDPQFERMPYAVGSTLRALEAQFPQKTHDQLWGEGGYRVVVAHQPLAQARARRSLREGVEKLDRRQGFRRPLGRLEMGADLEKIDAQLAAQPADADFVLARVVSVSRKLAAIVSAGGEGELHLKDAEWAAPEARPRHYRRPAKLKDLREILGEGDVIFVRKTRQPATDAPTEKARWQLVQEPAFEGAFIAVDSRTGDLIASVGGYDADRSVFHRAEQACRQPGSTFKPIVYAEAIARGLTPATMLSDLPQHDAGIWQPTNADRDFRGYIMLADALAQSRNIPTVHLANYLGIDRVIARAHRLGIESEIDPTASAALGASCVRPVELARVYAAFQRDGYTVETSPVSTIYDADGRILTDTQHFSVAHGSTAARLARMAGMPPEPGEKTSGMSPQIAYIVAHLLRRVATRGTAHALPDAWEVGAKTGTTNKYDGWFAGFDGELTAVAWVGSDKNERPLGAGEHGATAAMPVFEGFYAHYFTPEPAIWRREAPARVVWERIDPRSGLRSPLGQAGVELPFIQGTAPTEFAPTRGTRQAEQVDNLSSQF